MRDRKSNRGLERDESGELEHALDGPGEESMTILDSLLCHIVNPDDSNTAESDNS